jgi:hypothetical protein
LSARNFAMIDGQQNVISIKLERSQVEHLSAFMRPQKERKKGAIFSILTASFEPDSGGSVVKLETAWVPWKTAQKITHMIKQSLEKSSGEESPV